MTSRLAQMQARFQQKQIQEKEEKLLRLYESQQQRAFDRVGRGSAGSNASLGSTGGKVRQMFDERRQRAGVDKSYPLEPIIAPKNLNKAGTTLKSTSHRTTVIKAQKSVISQLRNGAKVNRRETPSLYNNNNDGIESVDDGDIVDLMNRHNLEEERGLDDEEMPQIGFDDLDETYFSGKLANLGGRLPSQITTSKTIDEKPNRSNAIGKTFRKDTKPIVKRTVKPATVSSPSPSSKYSSSPARTTPPTMNKSAPKPISESVKSPSNTRPSAKQGPKAPVVRDDLAECRYCNRKFASDRLQVHEGICSKTGKKKRRVYDATKHRIEGTELAIYAPKKGARGTAVKSVSSNKQSGKRDWRKTHEEFINAIRSAKQAQAHLAKGGKLSDLPPPPPSSNPDYVQCPHCGRKFNEQAAERHIPKCATYSYNKPRAGAAKGKR